MFKIFKIAPDPPTNLTVTVKGGKTAHVQWSPPVSGNYNGFKLKVMFFFFYYKIGILLHINIEVALIFFLNA